MQGRLIGPEKRFVWYLNPYIRSRRVVQVLARLVAERDRVGGDAHGDGVHEAAGVDRVALELLLGRRVWEYYCVLGYGLIR